MIEEDGVLPEKNGLSIISSMKLVTVMCPDLCLVPSDTAIRSVAKEAAQQR